VYEDWAEAGIGGFADTVELISKAAQGSAQQIANGSVQCGWAGSVWGHQAQRREFWRLSGGSDPIPDPPASAARGMLTAYLSPHVNLVAGVSSSRLSLAQQVARWSCLVDLEGTGFSARVAYLLHSGRPLLFAKRSVLSWYEASPFPQPFRAWDHFIPIKHDLSDLIKVLQWIQANPTDALEVGRRGQAFARKYLNPTFARRYLLQAVVAAHSRAQGNPVQRAHHTRTRDLSQTCKCNHT